MPKALCTFFIKQYILLYCIIFLNRIYFLWQTFPKDLTFDISLIIKAFCVGFIFDNSIISYCLLAIIAAFLFSFPLNYKYPRLAKNVILCIASIFFFTLCLLSALGTVYFKEFNFFPNVSIFEYTDLTSLPIVLLSGFLADSLNFSLSLLALCVFTFVYIKWLRKEINYLYASLNYSIKEIFIQIIIVLLLITLCILGARGGVSKAQLELGRGMFSQYSYINQFAINAHYNFMMSVYNWNKERKNPNIEYTLSFEELTHISRSLLGNSDNTFLDDEKPLLRITNTHKELQNINVVLIIMESFASRYIGAQGAEIDLSPNFNALIKEGVFCDNFYATGLRTNRGVPSILLSQPSPQYLAIPDEIIANQLSFYSLASILKERNYTTSFLYGGDANFDNMKGFLKINSVETIIDSSTINMQGRKISWGAPDDLLYEIAIDYFNTIEEPFFSILLTISNHSPYDIDPKHAKFTNNEHGHDTAKFNAMHFADIALGQFINNAQKENWAQNTLFVFVADHGFPEGSEFGISPEGQRIPFLLWSPNSTMLEPKIISHAGSQVDVLPTIMDILGGSYKHASFGKNLLDNLDTSYAFMNMYNVNGIISEDKVFSLFSDNTTKLFNYNTREEIFDKEQKDILNTITRSFIELYSKQIKAGTYAD